MSKRPPNKGRNVGTKETSAERVRWEKEYSSGRTIPSTTRREPSHILRMFLPLIRKDTTKTVLDAGCGVGRNSVYLAEQGLFVYAMDFSEAALAELSRRSRTANVGDRVKIIEGSLLDRLPFESNQTDLILDFYVSCEFASGKTKQKYLAELKRILAPTGTLLLVLFATDDEFYSRMPTISHGTPLVVRDTYNDIPTRLYTEQEIKKEVGRLFTIDYFMLLEFKDTHMGTIYSRRIFALALAKSG